MILPARFVVGGDWAVVPGPLDQSVTWDSQYIKGLAEHPVHTIALSILAFRGMHVVHPPAPTWWVWRARWEEGAEFLEVGMTLFDEPGDAWGGSGLVADCPSTVVLDLLEHLSERHKGIWLHTPECEMYARHHLSIAS
jgi:hypothetical protein